MKGKKTLATIIIGGALYKGFKGLVLGNPPSKIKKTIIYTALAGTLIYNSCQDQLTAVKNYSESSFNNYKELVEIKRNNESDALKFSLDSLYNLHIKLDRQFTNVVLKNGELIAKARESEKKYREEAKKLSELKSMYESNLDNNFTGDINNYSNNTNTRSIESKVNNNNNNRLVNIHEDTYLSSNKSVANRADYNSKVYWYVAKKFDTSKRIANNFTHDVSYAQKILDINGISEKDIIQGYPIVIPHEFLRFEHSALRKDYVPRNVAIRKNETLDEFVIRVKNPPTITQRSRLVSEIKRYNSSKGNVIDSNNRKTKSLVYLPNGW